ncbi:uncharacterized protein ACR2FA_010739 [Aphomia sociella]
MGSEQLIANELLAFIQHAIDTMDEVSIMQICKSNFKEEEICNSKMLLYQTLGKGDRIPSRRRDEKGERSLQDIISLLKETDPDDVPAFVAKQLHKLPPVTFDHVDVTRLLKDITTLKAGLVEVQLSIESANSPSAAASSVAPRPVPRSPTSGQLTSSVSTSTPRAYAAAAATSVTAGAPVATSTRAAREVPLPQRPSKVPEIESRCEPTRKATTSGTRQTQCDEEGFVTKIKKRKPVSRNLCGTASTGPNHLLRPEIKSTQLYVSRVHWSTKVEEVVDYIRKKSNFTLRVERLESRHKVNFSSFVVSVPTHHLATFMKEDFWPQGVVFRKFRGRLPADTARHTSPTSRVK